MNFFKDLFSQNETDTDIENFVNDSLEHINETNEPDFTMKELISAIKWLKSNKAVGPDGIPAEIFKECSTEILEVLLLIMNFVKNKSNYPNNWAWSITSLLFKEGDDTDPNNYRAISVADAISKILAIMLNNRLEEWNKENKIIRKEQIGFKKLSRPSDHLLVLKTLIDIYNNEGKKLFACFVDFQKAFDSVWRVGMFYKLIKFGMNKNLVKIIKNMYNKTRMSLKINNNITPPFRTHRGVRQGCILSPILFNLFINDIPDMFDKSCDPVTLDSQSLN